MELRHLRYFVAVAEELHFRRAAERLHIAQPPLSQQIRQLEDELGVVLFERSRRHVELTEPGRLLLRSARALLAGVEAAADEVRRAARGEVGTLAIGLVGSGTYEDVIPGLLRRFRERHPGVAITLHELTSGEQVDALREGRIQLGFLRPPVLDATIATRVVSREDLIVALPRTHRLARARNIALRDLAADPFIVVPREFGLGLHDLVLRACYRAGFTPRVVQGARVLQTIIGLVAAGFGISLVPAAARHLKRSGVAYVPLEPPAPKIEIVAAHVHGTEAPAVRAFMELVKIEVTIK